MMTSQINPDDYNRNDTDDADTVCATVPEDCAGSRFDQALAQMFPQYSRNRLQGWLKAGHILLEGKSADAKTKVWGGEQVSMAPQMLPDELAFVAQDIPLDVIYEDDTVLIIDKPAGLVVHPGSGNWEGTLLNGLLYHYPALKTVPRAGIVHRLDKETSGLMVVAKTLPAQLNLVQQLQGRSVKREYVAIAQGLIKQDGTVDAPIGRHNKDRTKMAVTSMGKPAITHYFVLERYRAHSLVKCRLETGRTHQIRVHMAHIGHSLAADPVYGTRPHGSTPEIYAACQQLGRQALHARKLGLIHPETNKPMLWRSPIPVDLQALIDFLRDDIAGEFDDDWDEDDYDVETIYQG
ncbi:23S rRNA pseudouridine(1911/1915/1917) synthase RluD [Chitinivorax sp. B]|uniref:23S rRNA pseudouridine(1911/1915/1917) synthase RluD n=1 Tax=Chitinivorax sp. B TaxID=2502235 RepID=UPI0010F6D677|nr:23S rRNA pseudouridine(1911/1915/1917) synthase RluD [Chitinivorax sp. B]